MTMREGDIFEDPNETYLNIAKIFISNLLTKFKIILPGNLTFFLGDDLHKVIKTYAS